jgi:Protein of unknown function (DUF1566)
MNNRLLNWLATIATTLFITACGGGGGGDSTSGTGDTYTSTATGKISDTGQTQCYYDYTLDGSYNPLALTCLAPGSGWSPDGQDGYYTINAMSFTDNGNGTILDNVTGLVWQKCAIGESGSACSTVSTTSYSWSAAKSQCANLGTGWRLPTAFELAGIIDYGKSLVTINSIAFPGTAPADYWSSTSHPLYTTLAWYVSFAQGTTWLDYQTDTKYARCVKG